MTRRSLLSLILFLCLGAGALYSVTATATAGDVTVEHSSRAAATKIKYPGIGVQITRLSGKQSKLKGASRSFKRYVVKRLDEMFVEAGSKQKCATAPSIVIDRFDSRGFVSGGEGSYGPCPGGGYSTLYKQTGSSWEPILGTQDVRYCQDLAFFGVTNFIGGPDCITEDGRAVTYRLKKTAPASPEASARRVARIVGGYPAVPSEAVLTDSAAEEVARLIATNAYVDVDTCVAAGDSDPLAEMLGDAAYGCSVYAYRTPAKQGTKQGFLLRMDDDFVVTDVTFLT